MKKLIAIIFIYLFLFNQALASVYISELYPNTDDDKNLEYIELTNFGSSEQSLSGFYLEDLSNKRFIFGSGDILGPNESIKYYRPETKIILNNLDEVVYLYDNLGNLVDKFIYATAGKGEVLNTSPPAPLLIGEGSSSGNIDTGSGKILDLGSTGSLETDIGSGEIFNLDFTSSGEIDTGTGEVLNQEVTGSGEINNGSGFIENNLDILVPEVIYTFQMPTYFVENEYNLLTYNCDSTKEKCSVNLDFRDSFSGTYNESDFNCITDFGFGTGNLTGEENKCNPNTIIVPVGIYNFNFKIESKNDNSFFSTGSFSVINNGYIEKTSPPVSQKNTSPPTPLLRGEGSNSGFGNIIEKINIYNPDIIVQSGLDENNRCKNEICKINLNYEKNDSKEECLWDFGPGKFNTEGMNMNCNPGYVEYPIGNFEIKLRVYQNDMESNYKDSILKFENKNQPHPDPLLQEREIMEVDNSIEKLELIQEFDLLKLGKVKINKIMPNPDGNDNDEYIELINNGTEIINLKGCILDDILDGGSKNYIFGDDIILPKKTKKYYKTQTNLNLNNYQDEVNFFCGENKIDNISWNFGVRSGYYLDHTRLDIINAKVEVVDVIDGDTIKIKFLDSGIIEVLRLIGVDTPETKHPTKAIEEYGIEASNFTKKELLGKEVFLEIDKNNFRDKYGRLLGYVFLNNENFNKILIEKGYGVAYLTYDFKYFLDFVNSEKLAKKQKIGIRSNKKLENEIVLQEGIFEEQTGEQLNFLDENNNQIPDEFEDFILDKSFTGTVDDNKILLDEEKSKQKYENFVINSFILNIGKLKSGLKISGKTTPNSDIFIELLNNKLSVLDSLISKANATQIYNTKSDSQGNYKFIITDITSGEYIINTKIVDILGNEFKIDKEETFELDSEYIAEMIKYSSENNNKKISENLPEIISDGKNAIFPIVNIQGKLGTKKIIGNNIYCYNTCSLNFDGSKSTGDIEEYLWDFGNGETYEGKNPKYIKYEEFGKYKVIFTLIGKDGEGKEVQLNIYFSKLIKSKSKKKSAKSVKNNNVLVKVTNATDETLTNNEDEDGNNNGFLYFSLIILFSLTLGFFILKREELI